MKFHKKVLTYSYLTEHEISDGLTKEFPRSTG